MEIKRNGHTYTYETLEELNKIYPDTDFYFILGADNLFTIEKWKYADKIIVGDELLLDDGTCVNVCGVSVNQDTVIIDFR